MADDTEQGSGKRAPDPDYIPRCPDPDSPAMTLDKAGLQTFLDSRVLPFRDQVHEIQLNDGGAAPSMKSLIGESDVSADSPSFGLLRPLAMGCMADDGYLEGHGASLQKAVQSTAESLVSIFEGQSELFGDIAENLRDTIHQLFNAQHDNLGSINGQKFLDIFDNVDEDLSSTSSTSDETETV
ncbi:type VII secretion system-associated protein [Streptomyces sp. NPDC048636]|uniref:type VII secretion system-associated protein n=1 Tax=Streptomyces sp. NPDC048636 TaxID=3155762 RepID=UPI0034472930